VKVPPAHQKLYERAMSGRDAWAAIRCRCIECFGWNPNEVSGCTSPGCPLFPYRLGYERTLQIRSIESGVPESWSAQDATKGVG
jgi:hypothetical protein